MSSSRKVERERMMQSKDSETGKRKSYALWRESKCKKIPCLKIVATLILLSVATLIGATAPAIPDIYVSSASAPTGEDTTRVWIRSTDGEMFAWDTSEQLWFGFSNYFVWNNRNAVDFFGYLRFGQGIDPATSATTLGWYQDRTRKFELAWANCANNTMGNDSSISFRDRSSEEASVSWLAELQVFDAINWSVSSGDLVQAFVVDATDDPDYPNVFLLGRETVAP